MLSKAERLSEIWERHAADFENKKIIKIQTRVVDGTDVDFDLSVGDGKGTLDFEIVKRVFSADNVGNRIRVSRGIEVEDPEQRPVETIEYDLTRDDLGLG